MFDGTKLDNIMSNWKPKKFTNRTMVSNLLEYGVSLSENSLKAYRNCRADPSTKTLSAMSYILNVPIIELMDDTSVQSKIILKKYQNKDSELLSKIYQLEDKEKELLEIQIDAILKGR